MLIEKERSTKGLVKTIFEINERIQNEEHKEIVYTAMHLGLEKKFGTKIANKIMEKIIGKGSDNMLAVEQMVLEENEMLRNEGINEGKNIMCVNMLKMGYSIETVSKISGLSVEEIKELKKNIK